MALLQLTQRSAPLRGGCTLGCHGTPFGLWVMVERDGIARGDAAPEGLAIVYPA